MNELKKAKWCVYADHMYGNNNQILSRWRLCRKGNMECFPSVLRRDGRKLKPLDKQMTEYRELRMCGSFLPTKEFQELQAKVKDNEGE